MPDNFFAFLSRATDRVLAFFTQLPDRVLLPVWEWILHRWEWIKDNPQVTQATIALGTLLVAVLAFRSSLETSKAQRKHNQLSVTPLLNIAYGNYDTDLFVSLVNNGTGPMVIKSIMVIGAANPSEPLINAMPDLSPDPDDLVTLRYVASDLTGRSIRAGGGEIVLLRLRYKREEALKKPPETAKAARLRFDCSRDTFRTALGTLALRVEYTNIYEGRFPPVERSLDYFVRNLPDRSSPPSDDP
jgi:hypothetical protein